MTALASWTVRTRDALVLGFNADRRHHGLQLAAAVLVAYGISALLHLPEHLWAVMTTLIVMRPNSGGTLEAGWDRARGTLIGALAGLAGVWLDHHGANPVATLLLAVAALAFVGAASPALRSAPIAALIVLGAGDLPGHSPLQVALLRMGQILLGVAVAMAVALFTSRYRAGDRFHSGWARLLRRLAAQTRLATEAKGEEEATAAPAGATMRNAIERLVQLAAGADREGRWFRRGRSGAQPEFHRRVAGLGARIVQDAALLNRVARLLARQPVAAHSGDGAEAAIVAARATQAAATTLEAIADQLEGGPTINLDPLAQAASGLLRRPDAAAVGGRAGNRAGVMLTAPMQLLLGDLKRLAAVLAEAQSGSPAA